MTTHCSCRVVLRSRERCVHNQEALRYFLDLERARAARRQGRVLVALVAVKGTGGQLAPPVADGIFGGLWNGLREVDVVGWLCDGRMAGAILTTGARWPTDEEARSIARRLQSAIHATVAADLADRVRVRVIGCRPGNQAA
jgi:hypothetical protein